MTRSWYGNSGPENNLAILTATPREQLPEKTTLTYATMSLGQDERNRIIRFNKSSTTHRIEVTDYSEYRTAEDYMAGVTKLNTEILAGKVPDIISVQNLPLRQYGAKGILEDLWTYIDNDPDISREKLMERVFDAAEQDGKLYQVFNSFYISTIIGATDVVGEDMGWTMAQFQDALASMPEGCSVFGESSTKDGMLSTLLNQNLDSFVNWETGECSFDGESFKTALAFCNSFPLEFDYENYEYSDDNSEPARIADGRQMLIQESINDFRSIQMYEAMFGGDEALDHFYLDYKYGPDGASITVSDVPVTDEYGYSNESNRLRPGRYITFKGYPTEDGGCGSSFSFYSGIAMTSSCKDKDGAWSFIRQVLLPTEEERAGARYYYSGGNFSVNKADFDKAMENALTPQYETDADGNNILDEEGNPIPVNYGSIWPNDTTEIELKAPTQSDVDKVLALYEQVDSIYRRDDKIMESVLEVASQYFAGDKPLNDAASLIQNKVTLYVNENR